MRIGANLRKFLGQAAHAIKQSAAESVSGSSASTNTASALLSGSSNASTIAKNAFFTQSAGAAYLRTSKISTLAPSLGQSFKNSTATGAAGCVKTSGPWRAFSSSARRISTTPATSSFRNWRDVERTLKKVTQKDTISAGYNYYRVAIVNALYTTQPSTHWARLVSLLLAEAVTRGDPLAWCYRIPVTEKEEAHLAATEEAEEAALALATRGIFRTLWRYIGSWLRLTWLLFLFTPVVLFAPIAVRHDMMRKDWLRLLRKTLERAGPAFIKWGQWAATRADLFPPDLCSELEMLHTQAPGHDFPFTEAAVKSAFGFDVEDLFSEFEAAPVASGSIGQIHKAVLSDTGARLTNMKEGSVVAVKVRHPGVSESIERDFALMTAAAKVAEFIPAVRDLRLEESLKQFAAPLREQVDLGREGFYLHAFNYNFRKEGNVSFPVPLYPLVAPAVLVETFEAGEHISTYVARGAGAPYNSDLAQVGARTMLHMMVVDNLVHSDLHPGNILVRLEPPGGALGAAAFSKLQTWAQKAENRFGWDLQPSIDGLLRPSIILLDAGMATRLSPEDQINMVGLFDSFSRLDAPSVANWVLRFAGEEQTCPDPEAFREDLEEHFKILKSADAFVAGDTSSGAEALASVLETVRQHQVNLPGHICATVVTTLVLEGWSHALDPAHSTLSEVKRILQLKRGESRLKNAALWIQGAAVDRQILEHVPQFAVEEKEGAWSYSSILGLDK